jgi:hypothetical protein
MTKNAMKTARKNLGHIVFKFQSKYQWKYRQQISSLKRYAIAFQNCVGILQIVLVRCSENEGAQTHVFLCALLCALRVIDL